MNDNSINNDDAVVPEIESFINESKEIYIINTLNEYFYNIEQNMLLIENHIVPNIININI